MSAHLQAQLLRFLRISGYAFVVALAATGGHVTWATLWSLAAGAAEAGLRQAFRTAPVPQVTSEPAPPPDSAS